MSAAEIIAELPRLSSTELAQVEAKLKELSGPSPGQQGSPVSTHPALGIWKGRTDLPDDPVEASNQLRADMAQRAGATE